MYPGERFNGYSHLTGFILALGAAALLLRSILPRGDAQQTAAALVFATTVVALYAASTLAHSVRGAARAFCERLDHCAIYLLIAGTYTPFALNGPMTLWTSAVLFAIWTLCGIGLWIELRSTKAASPPVGLYLAIGWICVVDVMLGVHRLTWGAIVLLLAGAACYSLGTIFYRNKRGYRHAHGIWHLFVLGGTTMHYLAIGLFVL